MSNQQILEPASAQIPNSRQKWFVRYLMAILIDLVVLNLFAQYHSDVFVDSFTISIFAAILLQILLKLTLVVEGWCAAYWKKKSGFWAGFMRKLTAWVVLFGSKFIILGAIDLVFGNLVVFSGRLHGVIAILIVLLTMLAAEELFVRIYRRLA